MNQLISLTPRQLRQAADLQERIAKLQTKLAGVLGVAADADTEKGPAAPPAGRKRKISAAGLERIRAAQKARWAKARAQRPAKGTPAKGGKSKGRMSAAAKAKIAARMKAVWAARKAAKS